MERIDYLPLGSIVYLNGGIKKLMIVARAIMASNNGKQYFFDYGGVLYPEGFLDPDSMFLFNGENIARVYHVGYLDEKTMQVLPKIQETLDRLKSGESK